MKDALYGVTLSNGGFGETEYLSSNRWSGVRPLLLRFSRQLPTSRNHHRAVASVDKGWLEDASAE